MLSYSRFVSRITIGLLALAAAPVAHAQILDPNAFASLGDFTLNAGTYTIDTDALSYAGNAGGILSSGIAVFDFSTITIGTNATINVTGTHPLALLSRSDFALGTGSSINLNGGMGGVGISNNHTGGNPPPADSGIAGAGGYAGSQGPGGGSYGFSGGGGGGGFGGKGGNGYTSPSFGAPGGQAYGDLKAKLEGGSGGGAGSYLQGTFGLIASGGGGGGGGGALEIATIDRLSIEGSFHADDGMGGSSSFGGGGGAGGGILLAGRRVEIATTGSLTARGGWGGSSTLGGTGGGGRITIQTASDADFINNGSMDVRGGNYYSDGKGVVTINGRVAPAPGSLVVAFIGAIPGGILLLRRKRQR